MAYYPVFLELHNRSCLVIGGGEIACQKAKALVACGARVRVVSPQLGTGLKEMLQKGKISWGKHSFQVRDLHRTELVVAATDQHAVNRQAAQEAQKRGIWINVVDQPGLCSFIVPSVVRRGQLAIAVSTGGVSPSLSKWIRQDLENRYGSEMKFLLEKTARVRPALKKQYPEYGQRKKLFEKALKAYFEVLGPKRISGVGP